jgi:hypothetical protein
VETRREVKVRPRKRKVIQLHVGRAAAGDDWEKSRKQGQYEFG